MGTKNKAATKPDWADDGMAFKVIKAGTHSYESLTKETGVRGYQNQPATRLYDALALRYNQTEPGDLLLVVLPNRPSTSNLRKIIEARGLKECDYRLFHSENDEHGQRLPKDKRPLALQRITDKAMRTVQPYLAIAARMAKEAEQRGASYNFAQSEKPRKPGIPGPSEQFSAENEVLVNT